MSKSSTASNDGRLKFYRALPIAPTRLLPPENHFPLEGLSPAKQSRAENPTPTDRGLEPAPRLVRRKSIRRSLSKLATIEESAFDLPSPSRPIPLDRDVNLEWMRNYVDNRRDLAKQLPRHQRFPVFGQSMGM